MESEQVTEHKTIETGENLIEPNMTIGDVVAKYPETVEVMLKYGLHCIGCHVSPYETLEQGSLGHGMPREEFQAMMKEVNEAAQHTHKLLIQKPGGPITVTEKAVEQLKRLMKTQGKEGFGLRVAVTAGGCAGFSYEMEFEKETKSDDVVTDCFGVKVFFDKKNESQLKGVVIDYRDSLQGGGFYMKNPNASHSCSCGQSFDA